jgi:hypothetical protein
MKTSGSSGAPDDLFDLFEWDLEVTSYVGLRVSTLVPVNEIFHARPAALYKRASRRHQWVDSDDSPLILRKPQACSVSVIGIRDQAKLVFHRSRELPLTGSRYG